MQDKNANPDASQIQNSEQYYKDIPILIRQQIGQLTPQERHERIANLA